MDGQDVRMEQLLSDPSFQNYCLGNSAEDVAQWEKWLAEHPAKFGVIQEARQLYYLLNGNHTAADFRRDKAKFMARLAEHLSASAIPAEKRPVNRSKRLVYITGVAAASVLGFVIFIRKPAVPAAPAPVLTAAYSSTPPGERKSLQLPDGTKVMLNAGSSIRLLGGFNGNSRQLVLDGEAFFDVARVKEKPFIIHTSHIDVRVLGTSFNIKAYPGDKNTEASLVTGSVEIIVKTQGNRKIILRPSEKLIVTDTALQSRPGGITLDRTDSLPGIHLARVIISPADSSILELSWTENKLSFSDDSFDHIARELERWYNVSVRIDGETIREYRFTGTFDKKTIGQVLNALASSQSFHYYEERPNCFVITGNNDSK